MRPATELGRVLVIIPTYNEAENLEMITGRIRAAVPDAHVLVADDASPDGTGAIADRLAAADGHVHVLHRRGKEGIGRAYLAGFAWGLDRDYGVLIQHDADGSHPPERLPAMLQALRSADLVKGSRWVIGGGVVNWSPVRQIISRLGSLWARLWLGLPIRDVTGGFNAWRADTLRQIGLETVVSTGYCFQIDLAWRTVKAGLQVVEVPITFADREFGDSKMSRDIVIEALLRTTLWGIQYRSGQLAGTVRRARTSVEARK